MHTHDHKLTKKVILTHGTYWWISPFICLNVFGLVFNIKLIKIRDIKKTVSYITFHYNKLESTYVFVYYLSVHYINNDLYIFFKMGYKSHWDNSLIQVNNFHVRALNSYKIVFTCFVNLVLLTFLVVYSYILFIIIIFEITAVTRK